MTEKLKEKSTMEKETKSLAFKDMTEKKKEDKEEGTKDTEENKDEANIKLEQGAKTEASKVETKLEGDINEPEATLN